MIEQQNRKLSIEELMKQTKCPKGYECYWSGLHTLCKASNIGLEEPIIICLEDEPARCIFAVSNSGMYLCGCCIRVYIAKRFKM